MGEDLANAAPELRIDPLTGAPVFIVGQRQARPNLPTSGCPFCPGGLEAPEPYETRWFTNRWPALPDGRAEIVLYTPDHTGALWQQSTEQVEKVIELWEERTIALGGRPDVDYVFISENRGPEVGATISHPHGQIYAFDFVPPAAAAELHHEQCPLCVPAPPEEVISERGDWQAFVPHAASWPYAVTMAPKSHVPDLPAAARDRRDMAALLRDVEARFDQVFEGSMPFMMWIHQRPTDGRAWEQAHLHVHFAPLFRLPNTPRFLAAGELGSGVFFNPVVPSEAAATLRELDGTSE